MSGPHPLPELTCRKCGRSSPWVYFAPVVVEGTGTCICTDCAEARGWLDIEGTWEPGMAAVVVLMGMQSGHPSTSTTDTGHWAPDREVLLGSHRSTTPRQACTWLLDVQCGDMLGL